MPLIRYQDPEGEVHVARGDGSGRWERLRGDPFGQWEPSGEEARVGRLLAPVQPAAIFCIGLNYRRHAAETGAALPEWPVLFMKSPGAVQDPEAPIALPRALASGQVDYEGELAVVIGRRCRNVSRDEALGAVLGFTCGNDVSARDWQKQWGGGQWCRGKLQFEEVLRRSRKFPLSLDCKLLNTPVNPLRVGRSNSEAHLMPLHP